jgi:thymidylate synthase
MNTLSKEEFLEKLKTDRDFNNRHGRKHITEGKMVLPPCHYGFQVYTRELSLEERIRMYALKEGQTYEQFVTNWDTEEQWLEDLSDTTIPTRAISLLWNQRSVDTFLGLPFNIASYGLLLEIIAKEVNMVPDELIGNLGDTHLYNNHIEQAKEQIGQPIFEESPMLYPNGPMNEGIKKQIMVGHTRKPYPLPTLKIEHSSLDPVELVYKLENYQSHPAIKAPLSN